MKLSIISWDCSYRNFFHLIDALIEQDFPKDEFEFIYVEQRTMELADKFNHSRGFKSLSDRYEETKDKLDIKVGYVNDPVENPYHLGKSVNSGLAVAQGEFIAIMDGDQLLSPGFLENLYNTHKNNPTSIVNSFRHMCAYPVGVGSFKDWSKGSIDYQKCLNACPTKGVKLPKKAQNKGPLISAHKSYWKEIGGYDLGVVWSTGLSKLGNDTNERLLIASGGKEEVLQDSFTVHPWHPKGIGALRSDKEIKKYFELQDFLTNWSHENKDPKLSERNVVANNLYRENTEFVDNIINQDLNADLEDVLPDESIFSAKFRTLKEQIKVRLPFNF